MGVRCRQATAMLSNDSPAQAAGLASALQAASLFFRAVFLGPGLATTPRRSHCTGGASMAGAEASTLLAQRPAPK